MAGMHASARLPDLKPGRPTQKTSATTLHPRRSPPREVKSLSGHKKQKLSHSPESTDARIASLAQLKSHSSGSDQSASHWFDKVNEHVRQGVPGAIAYNDEPPFFMSNQNNYLPNTFTASEAGKRFGAQSRLDSENEDLRGVIDDLTVENKRLKHILRTSSKSQRGSPSTDGQDKLFEVRMHGLSNEKKRELEHLLKNFATSIHTSAPSMSGSTTGSGLSPVGRSAHRTKSKTDSGYASNSNSGNPPVSNTTSARAIQSLSQSARDKNVKSYLHDIPDTLMPRNQPVVMSERSRMALVVRRLEQLFTGKKAVPGEHSQPLQQQEVSHMAARADANNSRKRKAEGTREAHILPPDTKVNLDVNDPVPEKKKQQPGDKVSESDVSIDDGSGSPDQRPTRPLDLDIHRAQVASENIDYIRHLGLSSPHMNLSTPSDDQWMYLNLLSNMAQLHTINVTPELIRKAVKKLSTKFELSKDGHKVRWVGGTQGTVFSKEDETALEAADKDGGSPDVFTEDSGIGGSSSKRSKTESTSNPVVSASASSEDKTSGLQHSNLSRKHVSTDATSNYMSSMPATQPKVPRSGSAFDYKPVVYRDRQRDVAVAESYLRDSESSPDDTTSADSSGLAHALSRSNLNQQRKSDEGLMTFYNNPFFCSDFSGDNMPHNMLAARPAVPGMLLGGPPEETYQYTSRLAEACYFTPQFGPAPFRLSENEKLPELDVAPLSSIPREEIQPKEFTVSGLGGTTPDDNFAIDVDVNMVRAVQDESNAMVRTIPHTGTQVKSNYVYKCASSHKIQLLPSRLPPPSYLFFTSSSSSGNQMDDDDDDDDSSESSESSSSLEGDRQPPPPSFLQNWDVEGSGEMDIEVNDDQDDSSVDMLAVARAADPVRIAEQERQYLINQPGGRAIAGSLAATVGASQTTSTTSSVPSDRAEAESRNSCSDSDSDSDDDADDAENEDDMSIDGH